MGSMMGYPLSIKKSKKSFFRSISSPIAMHWWPIVSSFCRICHDSFNKYLCVKVGRLSLVAEAGKIFLTRAFLEEIFAVSNFDALGSWGKHLCWAGEKCNIEAALLNVETIWSWEKWKKCWDNFDNMCQLWISIWWQWWQGNIFFSFYKRVK